MGYFHGCVEVTGQPEECRSLSPPPSGGDNSALSAGASHQSSLESDGARRMLKDSIFTDALLTIYSEDAWHALKRARGAGIVAIIALGFAVACHAQIAKRYKHIQREAARLLPKVKKLAMVACVLQAVVIICLAVSLSGLSSVIKGRNAWLRQTFGDSTTLQYDKSDGHSLVLGAVVLVCIGTFAAAGAASHWRGAAADVAAAGADEGHTGLLSAPGAEAGSGTWAHTGAPFSAGANAVPPPAPHGQQYPPSSYPGMHGAAGPVQPPPPHMPYSQQPGAWPAAGSGVAAAPPTTSTQYRHDPSFGGQQHPAGGSGYPGWAPSAPPSSGL